MLSRPVLHQNLTKTQITFHLSKDLISINLWKNIITVFITVITTKTNTVIIIINNIDINILADYSYWHYYYNY